MPCYPGGHVFTWVASGATGLPEPRPSDRCDCGSATFEQASSAANEVATLREEVARLRAQLVDAQRDVEELEALLGFDQYTKGRSDRSRSAPQDEFSRV